MNIISNLKDFGLNEDEAKIYICLSDGQIRTVVEIAKQISLPRTTVYDNIEKLSQKGLIELVIGHKTKYFKISPLNSLDLIIEKQRSETEKLTQNLALLKEELRQPLISNIFTQVKYYHGVAGLQQMMWNALSAEKETFGYSEFGRIEVVGEKFTNKWVEEFKLKGLTDRVITNNRPEIKKYINQYVGNPSQHQLRMSGIRMLPEKKAHISGDTTIYNNTFAVCYWRNGEIIGFEIENKQFVLTQKTIFETLWRQAKPMA